jgi:magnesium transporter
MTVSSHAPAVRVLHHDLFTHYPGEAARLLEKQSPEEVARMVQQFPLTRVLPVWERLAPDIGVRVLQLLEEPTALAVLSEMDANRAAALLSAFSPEQRDAYLKGLKPATAAGVSKILTYPEDSAGSMMDPRVLLLRAATTVREAVHRIRGIRRRGVRVVFVVDDEDRLQGVVDMQDLATAQPGTQLGTLQRTPRAVVNALAPRQEVAETLEKYLLTDLPVVDFDGRLIGVVRYRSLVEAVEDEVSVALQTMVGVSKDERALSPVSFAVRKRLPWLQINLATAFLAATVVGLFESTIAKYTALAVLLPVVAGQSGNTGAQALAVTMRGLALREIHAGQWMRIVFKETSVAFWNGIGIALTTALGVWLWSQSAGLAAVIGVSMVLSMIIAGISGAAIPLVLTVAGQDPAQSSSIVLTTVTDIAGFFSFLGIATLLQAFL